MKAQWLYLLKLSALLLTVTAITSSADLCCLPHEDYLYEDMAAHHHQWRFNAIADKIPQNMQLHFIGAIRDEAVSPEVHTKPIYNLLRARGMAVSYQEFDTGHIFTPCRIALTDTVFDLIAKMESKQ